MAQYDLLLTQNTAASGIEFSERNVNLKKGSILSANASKVPTVLELPTLTAQTKYYLRANSSEPTGLEWVAVPDAQNFHEQNTDTGTTSKTFQIDSDASGPKLKNDAGVLVVRNEADAADALLHASKVTVSGGDPGTDNELARKKYVDDQIIAGFAANDAMVLKGSIGSGGVITSEDTNINGKVFGVALTSYFAGWTLLVDVAQTVGTLVCDAGDKLIAIKDVTSSTYAAADWRVIQGNIIRAVTGPTSATANNFPIFDGSTGTVIKNSPYNMSSFAPASHVGLGGAAHAAVTTSTNGFMLSSDKVKLNGIDNNANNYSHPSEGGVGASYALTGANVISDLVVNTKGHVTSSGTRALTPADIGAMAVWVAAPANKGSNGIEGQVAKDSNFMYVCTATNTWKRSPIATNW